MRKSIQARQGGVGHIGPEVPMSSLERTTNNGREASGTKKNVRAKTGAKIVKEQKGPQGELIVTSYPGYDVYYTEDNMIGIAWADVVLK